MKKNLRSSFIPLTRTTPSKFLVLTLFCFPELLDCGSGVQEQRANPTDVAGRPLALQNFAKSPLLLGFYLTVLAIMNSFTLVGCCIFFSRPFSLVQLILSSICNDGSFYP